MASLAPLCLFCFSATQTHTHTHMYLTIIFSDVFGRLKKKFPLFNINHTFGIVFDYNLHLYVQLPAAFLPPYTPKSTSTKCHMYYLSSIQFFLFWLYYLNTEFPLRYLSLCRCVFQFGTARDMKYKKNHYHWNQYCDNDDGRRWRKSSSRIIFALLRKLQRRW